MAERRAKRCCGWQCPFISTSRFKGRHLLYKIGFVGLLLSALGLVFGVTCPGWIVHTSHDSTRYGGLFLSCRDSVIRCEVISPERYPERLRTTQCLAVLGLLSLLLASGIGIFDNFLSKNGNPSRLPELLTISGAVMTFCGVMVYVGEYDSIVQVPGVSYGYSMIVSLLASLLAGGASLSVFLGGFLSSKPSHARSTASISPIVDPFEATTPVTRQRPPTATGLARPTTSRTRPAPLSESSLTSYKKPLSRYSAGRCSRLRTPSFWTRILGRRRRKKKKTCQLYERQTSYPVPGILYGWVQGLCGAPDVPHAGHESQVSFVTEGNGVGVFKAPPVNAEGFLANSSLVSPSSRAELNANISSSASVDPFGNLSGKFSGPAQTSEVGCVQLSEQGDSAVNLCFKVSPVPGKEVVWETILVDNSRLYVEVPHGILPEGSRESLITLLEYAEEQLKCTHVILCFKKNRPDRSSLLRVFNFFGFTILPPGHQLVPKTEDLIFMAYVIDNDGTDSSDDDSKSDCGSE